ncbi:MAG: MFS transporter [candidate division Zixibacteria bacterium]|nr:MFS transporter [candidate division Zixibacteria bacterium]
MATVDPVYEINGSDIPTGVKGTFRALRHRNFRLFFIGQMISVTGMWMQVVAQSWLVYRLTGSAVLLGVVGFVGNLPSFVFAPLAGVLADRWNRHRLLVATQVASMIQALLFAVLILTNVIAVWHIIVLSCLLGFINAFDMPIRQSFVPDMLDRKDDLSNAIALNSTMVNGSRLIGPSIAGILIAAVGEGYCFLINGLSFIAVIGALLAMKGYRKQKKVRHEPVWQGLKVGFSYVFGFPPLSAIILLLALVSLLGMPYVILMPIFAKTILGGGPNTLGFLMAATGIGALVAAIYLASRNNVRGLGKMVGVSTGIFGLGLVLFSFSRSFPLSVALMAVTGFGMITQMAGSNTVLQTITEEDKRGRVMSFYTMAFRGMAPFSSLLAGGLASAIGAPYTLLISGLCTMLGALWYSRKVSSLRQLCPTGDVFGPVAPNAR